LIPWGRPCRKRGLERKWGLSPFLRGLPLFLSIFDESNPYNKKILTFSILIIIVNGKF